MPKPYVYVTRPFADSGIKALKANGYRVEVYDKDEVIPRKLLLQKAKGCDALLPLLTDRIDDEVLAAAGPQLKIVANYAVGFDNIDLDAAKKRGIVVTNTPSEKVNEAVAEHTFALMLSLARRITEADVYSKAKKYKGWSPNNLIGTDLYGKTLGIIGAGRIGAAVARRAVNGFGMRLIYSDMRQNVDLERAFKATFMSQDKLLKEADFISLHVPLLPSTRHLISTAQFSSMKKTAFLVNTARGPVVDEKALLRALKAKRIAGAGIDVFECEPAIDCDLSDNLELKSFPNVILTPHIASATIEAREEMGMVAAKNIMAVLSGEEPLNPAK
ncbi:MAG: D-glycerate dehydrogenase [Patescibacteria group bacterium]|nr:D-glycerate dehydrogenase [Patescibacteria group bacterium]